MANEITADMDIKQVMNLLSLLGDKHLRKATANTINTVARNVIDEQKKNLNDKFTLRNNFTLNSLKLWVASENKDVNDQNAVVGTVSPYLLIQEEGGVVSPQKNHIPIPTTEARGGDNTKPVKTKYRLNKIQGRAFVLEPATPQKTLTRRGLFYRVNEKEIVKIRDLEETEIQIKKTNWHSQAVEKWATQKLIEELFRKNAQAEIDSMRV